MKIYAVEKSEQTIGVFNSALDLLTFLYLHADDFSFNDNNEDIYDKISVGREASIINSYLLGDTQVGEWTTGRDTYTSAAEENGQDVTIISENRPQQSWLITMEDNTKFTISAPYMPLAVNRAQSEHIIKHGVYSHVKSISNLEP